MRVKEGWGVGSWSDSIWEVMKDAVLKCSAWGFLSPFPLLHRHMPGKKPEVTGAIYVTCPLNIDISVNAPVLSLVTFQSHRVSSHIIRLVSSQSYKHLQERLLIFTVPTEKGGHKGYLVNKWQSRLSWLWMSVWVTHSPEMSPESYLLGPASPFPPLAFPAGALSKHQGTSLEITISACWVTWSSGL